MAHQGIHKDRTYLDESDSYHLVFDLSIEDILERKNKAKRFDNVKQVADYLGVSVDTIFRNRSFGKRVTGLNNKLYSVRLIKKRRMIHEFNKPIPVVT